MVLITYDVNTVSNEGKKRLRQVAKECVNYGHRVQNSVFECEMDWAKCRQVKEILTELINPQEDSLRFYYLGNNWKSRVDHVGAKGSYDPEGVILI